MLMILCAREIRPEIRVNCYACFVSQSWKSERESLKDIPADADDARAARSRHPSSHSLELLRLLGFMSRGIGETV